MVSFAFMNAPMVATVQAMEITGVTSTSTKGNGCRNGMAQSVKINFQIFDVWMVLEAWGIVLSQQWIFSILVVASPARWLLKQSTNSSWILNWVVIPSQIWCNCSRQAILFKERLLSGSDTSTTKHVPETFGPSMILAVSRFWVNVNIHAISSDIVERMYSETWIAWGKGAQVAKGQCHRYQWLQDCCALSRQCICSNGHQIVDTDGIFKPEMEVQSNFCTTEKCMNEWQDHPKQRALPWSSPLTFWEPDETVQPRGMSWSEHQGNLSAQQTPCRKVQNQSQAMEGWSPCPDEGSL